MANWACAAADGVEPGRGSGGGVNLVGIGRCPGVGAGWEAGWEGSCNKVCEEAEGALYGTDGRGFLLGGGG